MVSFRSIIDAENGGTGLFVHSSVSIGSIRKAVGAKRSERVALQPNDFTCWQLTTKGINLPCSLCCQCHDFKDRKSIAKADSRLGRCENNKLDNDQCPVKMTCEMMWRCTSQITSTPLNNNKRARYTPDDTTPVANRRLETNPVNCAPQASKRTTPAVSPQEQKYQDAKRQLSQLQHQLDGKNNIIESLESKLKMTEDALKRSECQVKDLKRIEFKLQNKIQVEVKTNAQVARDAKSVLEEGKKRSYEKGYDRGRIEGIAVGKSLAVESLGPSIDKQVEAVLQSASPCARSKTKAKTLCNAIVKESFLDGAFKRLIANEIQKLVKAVSPYRKPEEVARGIDTSASLNLNGCNDLRQSIEEKNSKGKIGGISSHWRGTHLILVC